MNVVSLEIMLHHFYKPIPFPADTPAVRDAHAMLEAEGLIEETLHSRVGNAGSTEAPITERSFNVTERGRVFVNALTSVMLPVQAWTIPSKQ